MDRLIVTLDSRQALYMPAGQLVDIELREQIGNFNELDDRTLANHPRMRRILVRPMPHWPLACFYLHWSSGEDLTVLDSLVRSGLAAQDDFANALLGEAVSMTCLECKAHLRVVTWSPSLKLFTDSSTRAQSHAFKKDCPVCHQGWTASVLELIDR
ncbi:hypothetical protein IPZ58_19845 [Streptomyces roseoverticillatus]|uniref:hypothetical protein n=1 Tax=Streptomyces roseoverticillatus TaxID=66429 RepID=UPI001F194D61|nr:hypothetical protein [Streptomyces roseoverticillatus]MCF3103825.1 hypothetical protein [Streptomyces roseoverticillatus]